MKSALVIASFAGIALASAPTALAESYTGSGGALPDNGGAADPLISNISVADSFTIDSVTIDLLSMEHTFVGDLIVTLTHLDSGTSVELVNRPGVPEFSGFGWGYNLDGDYTLSDDGGVTWDDVNGGVQDTDFDIAPGVYLGENPLSAFAGENSSGDWELRISDNALFDTGALGSWRLNLTPVPAPSSLALLGLGALVSARRRRA